MAALDSQAESKKKKKKVGPTCKKGMYAWLRVFAMEIGEKTVYSESCRVRVTMQPTHAHRTAHARVYLSQSSAEGHVQRDASGGSGEAARQQHA